MEDFHTPGPAATK